MAGLVTIDAQPCFHLSSQVPKCNITYNIETEEGSPAYTTYLADVLDGGEKDVLYIKR